MVGVRVDYRTQSSGDSYPANYSDAARAVRLVRHRAAEWGIDSNRVGIMGFSAGGHLASLLSTQPALYVNPEDDLAKEVSDRPSLVVLSYPVVSFVEQYYPGAYLSTAENFFGHGDLSESLRRQFSNELHVRAGHPPVFIWTTQDDDIVPFTHSKLFAEACQRVNVPVVFTLYPHGPHGLGLDLGDTGEIGTWTTNLLAWLGEQWGQP